MNRSHLHKSPLFSFSFFFNGAAPRHYDEAYSEAAARSAHDEAKRAALEANEVFRNGMTFPGEAYSPRCCIQSG